MADDAFWENRFHACALAAGFIAAAEGRLDDSRHVRDLAYGMFEEGAFADSISQGEAMTRPRRPLRHTCK